MPEDNAQAGSGRTFDEAVADAYDRGKDVKGFEPDWFEVTHVFVRIENPIREYKVVITPGGG